MQFSWLEKLARDGHVSEKAKEAIYRDCSKVLKTASEVKNKPGFVENAVGTIALSGIWYGVSKLLDQNRLSKTIQQINKTKDSVLADPQMKGYEEKVHARFKEMASVAPTVATTPMGANLVKRRVHEGFTDQDMQHLAILQASYTNKDPHFAGKVDKQMMRKSAAQIGEACADILYLAADAGLLKVAAGTPAQQAGKYIKKLMLLSAAPVLTGVGIGAANHFIAAREQKKVQENLNHSFETAMRLGHESEKSPLIGDKKKARQAFETLAYFAPHVAAQPAAARAYMEKMLSYDMVSVPDIKELSEIERNMGQGRGPGSPFYQGFETGTKVLSLGAKFVSLDKELRSRR